MPKPFEIDVLTREPSPVMKYLESKGVEGYHQLTDEQIDEALQIAREAGSSINSMLPFTTETRRLFFKLFECQRCGQCCQGHIFNNPNDGIILTSEEIRIIPRLSGMTRHRFVAQYTKYVNGNRLLEFPCHFYDQTLNGCRIYKGRPAVCKEFPINTPYVYTGTGGRLDGVYMLHVNPKCPAGVKMLRFLLRRFRDHQQSLKLKTPEERVLAGQKNQEHLERARAEQELWNIVTTQKEET